MKIKLDLKGQKFGRLTVIQRVDKPPNATDRHIRWLCKCDCGCETVVASDRLKSGSTQSCGCLKRELSSERIKAHGKSHTKHGLCYTRLYNIYRHMISRCYRENDPKYKDYGGRGITVCAEWRRDFCAFYDWSIANGYADELTIDRRNNEEGYSPNNCRWVTNKEQQNNKRNNKIITVDGEGLTLAQAAEKAGVSTQTMWWRVKNGIQGNELLQRKIKRRVNRT